jgi:sec-independent protein translocase protein TatB
MDIFGIGSGELIVIALLAVIFLGPERLVTTSRTLARYIRELRKMLNEIDRQAPEELKDVRETVADLREAGREFSRAVSRPLRMLDNPYSIPEITDVADVTVETPRTIAPPPPPDQPLPYGPPSPSAEDAGAKGEDSQAAPEAGRPEPPPEAGP